jgi:hypothetical protein
VKLVRNLGIALVILAGIFGLSACGSGAEKVSQNLSTAADNFEIHRQVIFYNSISDEYVLSIEGRCSITDQQYQLEVTCKVGPDAYEKHFFGLTDNMGYFARQSQPVDADEYATRIILKPENLIPNVDLQTSGG